MAAVTWNPSDKSVNVNLSNGNLTAGTSTASESAVRATASKSSGKWYFEVSITSAAIAGNGPSIGVANSSAALNNVIGIDVHGWSICKPHFTAHTGATIESHVTLAAGQVVGVAMDLTAGKLWFAVNNTWINSGDPAAGTNQAYSSVSGTLFPAVSVYSGSPGSVLVGNFTAASQTYTTPSGFSAYDADTGNFLTDDICKTASADISSLVLNFLTETTAGIKTNIVDDITTQTTVGTQSVTTNDIPFSVSSGVFTYDSFISSKDFSTSTSALTLSSFLSGETFATADVIKTSGTATSSLPSALSFLVSSAAGTYSAHTQSLTFATASSAGTHSAESAKVDFLTGTSVATASQSSTVITALLSTASSIAILGVFDSYLEVDTGSSVKTSGIDATNVRMAFIGDSVATTSSSILSDAIGTVDAVSRVATLTTASWTVVGDFQTISTAAISSAWPLDTVALSVWNINTETAAAWTYTGLDLNSLCTVDGRWIGAGTSGIHVLDADASDVITWQAQTGLMDFDSPVLKHMESINVVGQFANPPILKFQVATTDDKQGWWFEARSRNHELEDHVIYIGKGIKYRYAQAIIKGSGQADVNALSMYPIAWSRRR